jgi:hypothetical protein
LPVVSTVIRQHWERDACTNTGGKSALPCRRKPAIIHLLSAILLMVIMDAKYVKALTSDVLVRYKTIQLQYNFVEEASIKYTFVKVKTVYLVFSFALCILSHSYMNTYLRTGGYIT